MQDVDIAKRPSFKDILEHDFFNQEFIKIHSFLLELPLKLDAEKTEFFKTLGNTLKSFDEVLVASQLSELLLSRMVLLNNTAQRDLLPLLLSPRQSTLLLLILTYKYLKIFQVWDQKHQTHYLVQKILNCIYVQNL